jgi:hypothetical protein
LDKFTVHFLPQTVNRTLHDLEMPLFSFPHDLKSVATCDLVKLVLYV